MWDLNSLTRDWSRALCIGSAEDLTPGTARDVPGEMFNASIYSLPTLLFRTRRGLLSPPPVAVENFLSAPTTERFSVILGTIHGCQSNEKNGRMRQ